MSEVFLPFGQPRVDDPLAAFVVQENVKSLAEMFTRGGADGDVLTWDQDAGKYVAAPGVAVPTVGTAFPANPNDRQEAIIVDSTSSPTFGWRFIYLASISGDYKWMCFGATSVITSSDGSAGATGASGVWANYSTDAIACRYDLPFEGIYRVRFGARGISDPAGNVIHVGLSLSGADPSSYVTISYIHSSGPVTQVTTVTGTSGTRYVRLMHKDTDSAARLNVEFRSIEVVPVRVKAA